EKAWVVSVVGPYAETVDLERTERPDVRRAAAPGECVVAKPNEDLYAAAATHPRLSLLVADACSLDPGLAGVGGRFAPGDVALGPDVAAGLAATSGPPLQLGGTGFRRPCDIGNCTALPVGGALGPGVPPGGPVPGGLPGGGVPPAGPVPGGLPGIP
ncbi:MAG: hypothetical protein MJE66_14605, partial [Proteobacteria bacterium]|nr:hypothetical protein [Pseudomonadota bacterium]